MVYTSTCNAIYYDPSFIKSLKIQSGFQRQIFQYHDQIRQQPFEPVIHTGNEKMLSWRPYVFTGLLCTEVILGAY